MKLGTLLDPRPAEEAASAPIRDAVNIPLAELPRRMYELPPPGEPLRLPDLPASQAAAAFLATRKREVALVPFTYGAGERTRLWRPNPFLEAIVSRLTPGTALDVGCGSGRDAVYLASLGWRVTALDILPDAIERGRELAGFYLEDPARIEWVLADVRREIPGDAYDLVVMFAFLSRPLLGQACDLLRPGSALLLETFTLEHRARHGRPASDELAVDPDELGALTPGLTVVSADAVWRGDRHTARLWATREVRHPVELEQGS